MLKPTTKIFPVNLQGRFAFLDGLRALAAVSVMLFHFFNHWVSPIHTPLARILPGGMQFLLEHGDLGLEVFFVVSGFVIAHSLFGKAITPQFMGSFIVRRSLRLDPPYWAAIVISFALPYLFFPVQAQNLFTKFGGTSGVLVNMFYLPDILWQPRIVGVAWTLCLEVQFYLAFLLLLAITQALKGIFPGRYRWISTVVAGTLFVGLLAYSVHRWISLGKNDFGGRWFMFFTGVLCYWTLAGRFHWKIFLGYLALLCGLIIGFREPRAGTVLVTSLAIYASAIFGGLRSWLGGKVFQYFGRISYSLYLVHMTLGVAAIHLVMRFGNESNVMVFLALAAAIAVSIVSADLLNHYVEMPAMRLSKSFRVATRPKQPAELSGICAVA